MLLEEITQGTKEADDLAHFILRNLYEVAAMDKGYKLKSITITKINDKSEEKG